MGDERGGRRARLGVRVSRCMGFCHRSACGRGGEQRMRGGVSWVGCLIRRGRQWTPRTGGTSATRVRGQELAPLEPADRNGRGAGGRHRHEHCCHIGIPARESSSLRVRQTRGWLFEHRNWGLVAACRVAHRQGRHVSGNRLAGLCMCRKLTADRISLTGCQLAVSEDRRFQVRSARR